MNKILIIFLGLTVINAFQLDPTGNKNYLQIFDCNEFEMKFLAISKKRNS